MTLAAAPERSVKTERIFFVGMALVVLASVFLGFAPTFYLRLSFKPAHVEPLIPFVFLHGVIFSAWILLFVAQTAFVATDNLALHRRLGPIGVVLVVIMIPVATIAGIGGIHRPLTAAPGVSPLSWAALPLLDVPVFGGLILAALAYRRKPQTHKRLMLCALVDMMRPALGRFLPLLGIVGPIVTFGPLVFLLPLIAWDLASRGRVQPATLWGSLAVAGVTIATPIIWSTPAWLSFAGALAKL